MIQKIKLFTASLVVVALAVMAITPTQTYALNPLENTCNSTGSADNPVCQNQNESADNLIKTIINILLYIVGALAVIMLIWGGIRYVTSGGNSASLTAAKNTIMYALIGLVVAILAFAIVQWVFGQLAPKP